MPTEHTIRTKSGKLKKVSYSRSQAIKVMCTECSGHGEFHPKDCTDKYCPLFPFRGRMLLAYDMGSENKPVKTHLN